MSPHLADRTCEPCRGGAQPLGPQAIRPLAEQLPDWTVVDDHHIEREFRFPDFATALAFVNVIGGEAEMQGHHPDVALSWGCVGVTLFTHKIGGLSEADFIMAARIDRIWRAHESVAPDR